MKRFNVIVFCLIVAAAFSVVHAGSSEVNAISGYVGEFLPAGWRVVERQKNIKPYWSFSNDTCIQLTAIGPRISGFKYLDTKGNLIMKFYSQREALILWIAPDDFDPDLSIVNRIKNRLNLFPKEFPAIVFDGRFKVYGTESFFVVDKTYSITSPPGTHKARHLGVNRSWPSWKKDLKSVFSKKLVDAEN